MSAQPVLPTRITRMGKALRPLLEKARQGAADAVPSGSIEGEPATGEFLARRLEDLEEIATRLEVVVEGLMSDVVSAEDAGAAEIDRAVARLEDLLDDSLDGRARLQHAVAESEYQEGRDLLVETYRDFFGQVESWLDDLVETIADPIGALERKGLPTSGYVEIPFDLNLVAPPELEEFGRWADRERRIREALDSSGAHVVVYLQQSGLERVPPPHLRPTGEAMRPLLLRLYEALERKARRGWLSPEVTGEFISGHLHRLADTGARLEDAVESLIRDVITASDVEDSEMRRAVARVRSCVDAFAASYEEVQDRNATGAMVEGRRLIASDYLHTLEQIGDWLERTIETLGDPLAAYGNRDLPAGGKVGLPIGLGLTRSPAVDDLWEWAEDLRLRNEADAAFWGTAFAVALGAWIGCGLFDD